MRRSADGDSFGRRVWPESLEKWGRCSLPGKLLINTHLQHADLEFLSGFSDADEHIFNSLFHLLL